MPKRLTRPLMVLLAALLLAAVAAPARADVRISARTKYYDIRGRTAQDLWRQLQSYSIRTVKQKGHILAQCQYRFVPDGKAVQTNRGWVWTDVEVTLNITYIYPNWVSVNYSDQTMKDLWAKVIDLFERHEEGHAVIALRNANLMVQRMRAIGPQATPQALQAHSKAILEAILARDDREQTLYDEHCTDNASLRGFFREAGADTSTY